MSAVQECARRARRPGSRALRGTWCCCLPAAADMRQEAGKRQAAGRRLEAGSHSLQVQAEVRKSGGGRWGRRRRATGRRRSAASGNAGKQQPTVGEGSCWCTTSWSFPSPCMPLVVVSEPAARREAGECALWLRAHPCPGDQRLAHASVAVPIVKRNYRSQPAEQASPAGRAARPSREAAAACCSRPNVVAVQRCSSIAGQCFWSCHSPVMAGVLVRGGRDGGAERGACRGTGAVCRL